MKPLAIELFAGTFGWSAGWLARGGEAIGFDIEHLPHHGPVPKNAWLVLQDVRTLHGSQFKDASIILASSPCQEFSYRAMPWKRAKALGPPVLGMELFAQAARIQREACEAAGHYIPMIQENVKGAQPWVGRAKWRAGSFFLWGDVPALMPVEVPRKNTGGSWFAIGSPNQKVTGQNPVHQIANNPAHGRGQGSQAVRKAASALIARIPASLSDWIAHVYYPQESHV